MDPGPSWHPGQTGWRLSAMDARPIELPGLRATVMRSRGQRGGQSYWRARATTPERPTVWTGWGTREEVLAELVERMARGALSSRPASPAAEARTVGDLLDRWVVAQRERLDGGQIAERSLKAYEASVAYWQAELREVSLARLQRIDVEDCVRRWRAAGVAPRTAKLAVSVLAAAWRWGVARSMCRPLDLRRLEGTKVRADEHVYNDYTPTREEATRVLARVPPGRNRDVIELLALTGARIGEVLALAVDSYDRRAGELVLSGRSERWGRRGKVAPRRFPVHGRLGELLEQLVDGRSGEEPLVEGLVTGMPAIIRTEIRRACAACEPPVPGFSAHGLRRMVAMELVDVTDPKTVSLLTGHTVEVLLRSYVRPRPESLRDAVLRSRRTAGTEGAGQVIELATRGRGRADECQ
jgi:integrase